MVNKRGSNKESKRCRDNVMIFNHSTEPIELFEIFTKKTAISHRYQKKSEIWFLCRIKVGLACTQKVRYAI